MTAPALTCGRLAYWFDVEMTTSCRRPQHHDGDHCDGLRWFDDHGFQRPGDPREGSTPQPRGFAAGSMPRDKRCDACGRDDLVNLGAHRRFCGHYRMAGAA